METRSPFRSRIVWTALIGGGLATAALASEYAGLARSAGPSGSIIERFAPPDGYARVPVAADSYKEWLRQLPLLPDTTPARDWTGRLVFAPHEIGGVLDWRLLGAEEQCADIVMRLLAEYAWTDDPSSIPAFRSLSGQEMVWARWLSGRYGTNTAQTAIVHTPGARREPSRRELDAYLRFVMTYANTASLARDWPEVAPADLAIGDVVIQPHCTGQGMGHLSVVVDACRDADGHQLYLFVDGFTPARDPVVRQRLAGDRSSVWMTLAEYLQLQSVFGPGFCHRPPAK